LEEIARRGRLGAEFSHALIANAGGQITATPLIEQGAEQGDVLAGFYSQWLMPDRAPAPPPHAWAWDACRFWQQAASPEEWGRLEGQFAEMAAETAFLRLLQVPGGSDWESSAARWRARYANQDEALTHPVLAFLAKDLERLPRIGPDERSEIALAVLAGGAEPAPEFAS